MTQEELFAEADSDDESEESEWKVGRVHAAYPVGMKLLHSKGRVGDGAVPCLEGMRDTVHLHGCS